MNTSPLSPAAARHALTDHPRFKYRGCAPDPLLPSRMAGDLNLPVGAHMPPTTDGGEDQKTRLAREAAAVEVCLNCPVMVACDAYANTVGPDGKLAEPEGIWGGRLALERHRAVIAKRIAAPVEVPDAHLRSAQKTAVLHALAGAWDPHAVADAAGVDVRTANWQRSSLVRLLGLPRAATRMELLTAAADRGLLDPARIVPDDVTIPAIAPPTRTPATTPPPPPTPAITTRAATVPPAAVRLRAPRRDRFADITGQLTLDDELDQPGDVRPLFPDTACLEVAA